ncbi:MAG: nucleotidyltransferase family protein [Eubacteriales bacterium]|nr:nucleotidyltransferase family protein [Eubacteriales bacterium]
MNITGIIAEYNPFHNGHFYQLKTAREVLGADYVIVVMSGDFVQRGEPAVFDKYTRTAMALSCGADLVLELPAAFATGSAESFAACAVSLLDRLGVADQLCFGSESGDTALLSRAADLLLDEPEDFRALLKEGLRQGLSWPAARGRALEAFGLAGLLSSPNDILAAEYIKALKVQNSAIAPRTVLRRGSGYNDASMPEQAGVHASASALRKRMRETAGPLPADVCGQLPAEALKVLLDGQPVPCPVFPDDFSALLQYRLLSCLELHEPLSRFADLSPEMAARLTREAFTPAAFTERIRQIKTKQYTYTRISRALLHLILGITAEETARQKQNGYAPYGRVLGFRRQAAPLLSAIRANSSIPLVTKTADAKNVLTPEAFEQLSRDMYASHVYQSILFQKGRQMKNEYTRSVIICP